ncbi:hypothetical protein PMIT1306_02214 [Prochlorococcus sp. MIT 1306]|nr:hypothetical protein PMIT1306_02214 [Prochlorococcus sp. MIT 1306]
MPARVMMYMIVIPFGLVLIKNTQIERPVLLSD